MEASGDPDAEVLEWLRAGAPAGIECHPELKGVFPPKALDEANAQPRINMTSYRQGHRNYTSVEEDSAAIAELNKLVASSFVSVPPSRRAVKRYLRSEPVLSKLATITKETATKIKRRRLLDCRVSGTSSTTRKFGRVVT